jgi:hypothetical protein
MCTSCRDITTEVNRSCESAGYGDAINCTLSLPRDQGPKDSPWLFLPAVSMSYTYSKGTALCGKLFTIANAGGATASITFPRVRSIYLDVDPATVSSGAFNGSSPAFKSSFCSMSPCIHSVQASYKQSDSIPYAEKLLKSWTAEDLRIPRTCELPAPVATDYGLDGKQNYTIESFTCSGITIFFGEFDGYYEKAASSNNEYKGLRGERSEVIYALWNGNYTGCAEAHKDNRISCGLDLVAKAMSRTFRDFNSIANSTSNNGNAFAPVIHVTVS